jgi:excisionase family DNA binding protein
MSEELLSVQELADEMKIPVATLYNWNHRGYGPRPIKLGKHLRYRRSEVERFYKAQEAA